MSTMLAPTMARARAVADEDRWRWGRLEWFLLVVILGSALVFIPGSGLIRAPIRGAPYAMSLAILIWHYSSKTRRVLPASARAVLPAMLLYAANLAHPFTDPVVGVATVIFHISIAAPVFWAASAIRSVKHLEKLLWFIFLATSAHVVVGLLQTAFPLIFMPPEIAQDPNVLAQQTYMGPFGQMIIRPPGLSDLPGGASSSATIAAVMGVTFMLRSADKAWVRILGGVLAVMGLFVLYLTQVRVFAVLTIFSMGVFVFLAFMQGRGRAMVTAGIGIATLLVLGGLQSGIGYDPTDPYAPGSRFGEILENGLLGTWMQSRGHFFELTMREYVWQYPLGAGLGRWGMMREYFGANTPFEAIWVEIQLTGWLFDAGIPMWFLYGGAICVAMYFSLRLALDRKTGDLAYFAATIFTLQAIIAGSTMAGPAFNSTFGITFWVLTAMLYGANQRYRESLERASGSEPDTALQPSTPR